MPDLVIFIDISVDEAMERLKAERNMDRIEERGKAYYEKVRQNFLDLTTQYPCAIIDSNGLGVQEVHEKITDKVKIWLKEKGVKI